jgi:hypothetical protein
VFSLQIKPIKFAAFLTKKPVMTCRPYFASLSMD